MNKQKKFNKQRFSIVLLVILIIVLTIFFPFKKTKKTIPSLKEIENKTFDSKNEIYEINIEYPFFYNEETDEIIDDYLYKLVLLTKQSKEKVSLNINYELFNIEENTYLVFNINKSDDSYLKYKSFLLKDREIIDYNSIFNIAELKTKTLKYFKNRYSSTIYKQVGDLNFKKVDYLINKDEIIIYFYDLKTDKMSYVPTMVFNINDINIKKEITFGKKYEFDSIKQDKYIALTFDDGPSDVTTNILDILENYDAHVTFFSLGNRMNRYKDTIKREVSLGHMVASHTYSHKDLTTLSEEGILDQLNSTNTTFDKITGDKITLLRPPYGHYDNFVLETVETPLILWNIDPKDWYYLDHKKIADIVIKKAFDGGIVIFHDLYAETKESLKIILPELTHQGYKFVTIEEMAEIYGIELKKGRVYRYIQ